MFQGLPFLPFWLTESTWLLSLCQVVRVSNFNSLILVEGGAGLKWIDNA